MLAKEVLADRNLVFLFPGRFCQHLINAVAVAWSHQTELGNPVGELVEGLEEQREIAIPSEKLCWLAGPPLDPRD